MKSSIAHLLIISINLLINVAFIKTVIFDIDSDDEASFFFEEPLCDRIKFPGVERASCLNGMATTYTSGRKYRYGKCWWPLLAKKVENPRLVGIHYYEASGNGDFGIGFSTNPDLDYVSMVAETLSHGVAQASRTALKFQLKTGSSPVLGVGLIVSPPYAREPVQAFFTVNGKLVVLGRPFGYHIPISEETFNDYDYYKARMIYPYVSTAKANTIIQLNFGIKPFMYNVKAHPLPLIKYNRDVFIEVTVTYFLGTDSKGKPKSHKLNTLDKAHFMHAGNEICQDSKIKIEKYWIREKTNKIYNIDRNKCQPPTSAAGMPTLLRLVFKLPSKLFPRKSKGDHFQTIDIEIGERLLNKSYYPGFELRIQLDCNKMTEEGKCQEDPQHSKLLQSSKYQLYIALEDEKN